MEYYYKRQVDIPYEAAVIRTVAELKKEGFGVPSKIDVRELLKEKLNVEFNKYIILGSCNPPFAYRALQTETDIGLLMPCNVIVYEKDGQTFVAAIKPTLSMQMVGKEGLRELAVAVENKLKKVVDSI